jgi:DNA-binding transcriptional LysR family regulator
MEIRQLQMFRALAEELHFTRAAARVHCAQSNVTTRIRALEDELGAPLFDRLAKRITLTDSGKRILPHVERMLATMDDIRNAARADAAPAGDLLIGASESMLTYRLPEVLGRFRKRYPAVHLSFRPYPHEKLLQSIEAGMLDLAICMVDAIDDERLRTLRLRDETLTFIAGPKDPLASRKRLRPRDLAGQTLLVTEAGCAYREQLNRLFARVNVQPTNTIEFSSVEAIKQCVSLGMGIALLPQVVVADGVARNRLKPLHWTGAGTHVRLYVVWHRDKWISPTLRAFIEALQASICAADDHDKNNLFEG